MGAHGTDCGAYIADIARELAKMARADRRHTLSYLLEIVSVEAEAGTKAAKFRPASKERNEVERV
jgi:hypothetical protein